MLKVCITFDYEIFLGKNNASYQEILFRPTENLMNTLNSLGVSGTFFADVCSVYAHSRLDDNAYADQFTEQIQHLISNRQDVQLHLHTNWFYAEMVDGKIVPGSEGYRLHSFGFEKAGKARDIIKAGKEYLEKTCQLVDPEYKCIAYRAGGFSVQPEKELFRALLDNGILIDSSVVPHMRADSINYYDFTKVPRVVNWWIDPDQGISQAVSRDKGTVFEVPIATVRPRLLQAVGKSKSELSLPSHKILGEYVKSDKLPKKQGVLLRQYHRLFDYRYISLDTRYYMRILEDLDYLYKKYELDDHDGYICLICHPKLADQSRVDNIRNLIVEIQKTPEKFAFVNFMDIYNSIK